MALFVAFVLASSILAQQEPKTLPTRPVTIKVVMPDGKPAPGIEVGRALHHTDGEEKGISLEISPFTEKPPLTDESGSFVVDQTNLYVDDAHTRPRPIVAVSKDRSLVGVVAPKSGQFEFDAPLVLTLAPACHVTAKLHSSEVTAMGRQVKYTNLYIWQEKLRPFGVERRTDGIHEFILPPGDFRLFAYGTDTVNKEVPITIVPGDKERSFDIDIPANVVARMIGKPPPEFRSIKGWKNGDPVKLSDLKGKIVLLDFWGTWCGPCVYAMPELMELHDKYKDKGLVIIAIHDDSVASIAEMESKMQFGREKVWNNRDLPFLIALDGGGETQIEGDSETASGATTARYGITMFPTQILIGRDGNVIGKRRQGAEDQLPALMETK